jgi:hypothetical protein
MRILAAALALLLSGCTAPAVPPPTYSEVDRVFAERRAEHAERKRQLTIEFVRIHHGDSDATWYGLCSTPPEPSQKVNQQRCARLMARTQRELAAQPPW